MSTPTGRVPAAREPVASDLPPGFAPRLQQAREAMHAGRLEHAERLLAEALDLAPGNAEAHRLAGIAASLGGQFPEAIGHLRAALAQSPDDVALHTMLGGALAETGALADALVHMQQACELAPKSTTAWYNVGALLKSLNAVGPARDALQRAVAIDPDNVKARHKLADVLVGTGETQAAVDMLRDALRRQPDCVDAWLALGNIKTLKLGADDADHLRALCDRPGASDDARIALGFTLARALEDQAEYAAAFDAVSEANALKRRHLHWDRREERSRVLAIERAFAGPLPGPQDPALGGDVIFVVSLPRSASTLVEQILASHPCVTGGGELGVLDAVLDDASRRRGQPFPDWVGRASRADWTRLGEDYLERVRRKCGATGRFTDKSIDNWSLVGAALAMLPGAHVVNSRRDALETCFACYRQLFAEGCHGTYELDDMVGYYAGYERLSALWQRRFPDRYLDNPYEVLQSATEPQIRRLLAFCGLSWDPACLAFHRTQRLIDTFSSAQVREPIRSDTARAARYGTALDPLRAKLRAAGIAFADN